MWPTTQRATPKSWNPSSAATPTSGCGSIVAGARGPKASLRFIEVWKDRETERRGDGATGREGDSEKESLYPPVAPSPYRPVSLMIVAGEASGDKHGAKLVAALRALRPGMRFEFFG